MAGVTPNHPQFVAEWTALREVGSSLEEFLSRVGDVA